MEAAMPWIFALFAVVVIVAAWLAVPTTAPVGCLLGHDWIPTFGVVGDHVFATFQCARCGRQRRFFTVAAACWNDLETGELAPERWRDRCSAALRRNVALREMGRVGA